MSTATGPVPPAFTLPLPTDPARRDRWRRLEEAGLNASAMAAQRWQDGWLLRFNPGKAKRARCVWPLAAGRRPLDARLHDAAAACAEHGVPLLIRITAWVEAEVEPGLDTALAARGWTCLDDTRVMVRERLDDLAAPAPGAGLRLETMDGDAYAALVGALRGTPAAQIAAHAQRLRESPVRYRGVRLLDADGSLAAVGQAAREGDRVGLYDVFTPPGQRGRGHAGRLCAALLAQAAAEGARSAYLQVEADNAPARAVYARLGFGDAYGYHYRQPPA
jgi:ribosomal protein S18 acetylase RimI-like enzyme